MLTPIEIQNHSLKTAVRGYSKKETDDFLEEILQGYESLYKENRELKDKVASLSEGVQYYKQMETTLQKALVLAEKTSAETQEAAKSKADAMTNEAQAKAESMTKEAQAKAESVTKEAQAKAESVTNEAQAKAESLLTEAQTRADSLLTESQTKANSLLTEAQTKANSLLTGAQTKADSLLTEAQTKSDSMLKEAQAETDGIRKEIHAYSDITKAKANRELEETRNHVRKLVQSYETYRLQFKKLAESQIEMLESENYSIFVPELAEMLDDAPDADTAMETRKTVAINLKSSEQIARETGAAPNPEPSVAETAKELSVLEEAAVGQESAVTGEGQAVYVSNPEPEQVMAEEKKPEIHASDIVPGSISAEERTSEISASDIVPGSISAEERTPEISASDIVPGSVSAEERIPEININNIASESVSVEESKPKIRTNDLNSGSVNKEKRKPEINTNTEQEIRATDIVPGNPAAFVRDDTTPKIEGYEGAPMRTVMPNNDSPFTFIDTE